MRRPTAGAAARLLFWTLALLPLWYSLGGHAIQGDSEARYAAVAHGMAFGGESWWVPNWLGDPHLTKPPAAYWAQAVAMRALYAPDTPRELLGWAFRLPGALAGTWVLVAFFRLVREELSAQTAYVATGLLAGTPLFVAVHRLGITDGPLHAALITAVAAGVRALRTGHPRHRRTLWAAAAAAFLIKGPAALPLLIAFLGGAAVADPRNVLAKLRPARGFVAAVLPLIAWSFYVWWRVPGAGAIWRSETLGRFGPNGAHPEPVWFFLPVLLIGAAPATFWLTSKTNKVHRATLFMLGQWLVFVPLLLFSLQRGKLMSYLAPVVPWCCLLATRSIFTHPGAFGPSRGSRYLFVMGYGWYLRRFFPGAVLLIVGLLLVAVGPDVSIYGAKLTQWPGVILAVCGVLVAVTEYCRVDRLRIYAVAAVAWVSALLFLQHFEDRVAASDDLSRVVQAVRERSGLREPLILTVGFSDRRLACYTNRPTYAIDPRVLPEVWEQLDRCNLILLADARKWSFFARDPNWDLSERYELLPGHIRVGREPGLLLIYRVSPALR